MSDVVETAATTEGADASEVKEEVKEVKEEVQEVDVNELVKQVEELKKLQAGADRAYQESAKKAKALQVENEKLKTEKMTDAEKLRFENEKREKDLEEKDRELRTEKANFTRVKVVGEMKLPVNTADFIQGETEADIKKNANKLKAVLEEYASAKVDSALGTIKTPKAGSEEGPASKDIKTSTFQEIERLARGNKL